MTYRLCDLRHMKCFVAVAEELSFRRAANRLHIAQPALSRTIKQLEERLDAVLLERNNRRVSLTETGKLFLEGCQRTLASAEQVISDLKKSEMGEIGDLQIGHTELAINGSMPTILMEFRQMFPRIRPSFGHMVTSRQLEALSEGDIDVGFLTGPINEPFLDCIKIQDERMVVVLSESNPLAGLDEIPMSSLADEPFVVGRLDQWSHFNDHLMSACNMAGIRPSIVQEADTSGGIFGLVAADMGVTLHGDSARNLHRKGVVVRPIADLEYRIPTVVAWHRNTASQPALRFSKFSDAWRRANGTLLRD